MPYGAVLVVAEEGMALGQRRTLSAREAFGERYMPMLWIIPGDSGPSIGRYRIHDGSLAPDGQEATSRLPTDTLETISPEKLDQAGRALTLALMALGLGRETQY